MWKLLVVLVALQGCRASLAVVEPAVLSRGPELSSQDVANAGKAAAQASATVIGSVAAIPGNLIAADASSARDHEIAVHWFDEAVADTRRDDCAAALRVLDAIAHIDPHYHESVFEDPRVAWCTVRGKGASEGLTRVARDFALRAECAAAVELGSGVLHADRRYYSLVFLNEPAIVGCWLTAHTLPARVTDAHTMQFAAQARNAARRLDCRGARASLGRMRDDAYRAAFVASPAYEACR